MDGRFHTKSFISIFTFGSFFIMTVTGLVLYFVPQGRVAYWIDWHLLGMSKIDWGNIHIVSSILFGVAGAVHLYLNWRPFWTYLTKKTSGTLQYGKEILIASVLSIFLFIGTLYNVPPLNYLIHFGEILKTSWVKDKSYEPPFGHAEQVSIKVLSKKEGFDLESGLNEMRKNNIKFSSADEKLEDVAGRNMMSPRDLYAILIAGSPQKAESVMSVTPTPEEVEERFAGTGIGRQQFTWIMEDIGLSLEEGKKRLAKHDIEVQNDETIKNIATKAGYDPMELLTALLIPDYVPKKDDE